jgi:NAD+ kinase
MSIREVIIGGSFNPPGLHHRNIVEGLMPHFDRCRVYPCGERPDKPTTNDLSPLYRATMTDLAFGDLGERVVVDLSDLSKREFTRTYDLDKRLGSGGVDLWHAVGTDLLIRGDDGLSPIERSWHRGRELLAQAKFAVMKRDGYPIERCSMPEHYAVFDFGRCSSSQTIRTLVRDRLPFRHLTSPAVASFIERHGLYLGGLTNARAHFSLREVRAYLYYYTDPIRGVTPQTESMVHALESLGVCTDDIANANVIIVIGGDGTMLDATRRLYRHRLPFFGINTGQTGYQLNNLTATEAVDTLLGGVESYLLPMLESDYTLESGEVCQGIAYNEIYLEKYTELGARGKQASHFSLSVRSKKDLWPERYCDLIVGSMLLVATPQGSTGYAMDLGYDPLMLDSRSLLLVGGAINRPVNWRGMPLPSDAEITIRVLDEDKRPADGNFDNVCVGPVSEMTIRQSAIAGAEICFTPNMSPTTKLMNIKFPRD